MVPRFESVTLNRAISAFISIYIEKNSDIRYYHTRIFYGSNTIKIPKILKEDDGNAISIL